MDSYPCFIFFFFTEEQRRSRRLLRGEPESGLATALWHRSGVSTDDEPHGDPRGKGGAAAAVRLKDVRSSGPRRGRTRGADTGAEHRHGHGRRDNSVGRRVRSAGRKTKRGRAARWQEGSTAPVAGARGGNGIDGTDGGKEGGAVRGSGTRSRGGRRRAVSSSERSAAGRAPARDARGAH